MHFRIRLLQIMRTAPGLFAGCWLAACTSGGGGTGGEQAGDSAAPIATTFSKSFGGPQDDYARAAIPTSDGGYLYVGTYDSDEGKYGHLWVNKLDANGNSEWQRIVRDPGQSVSSAQIQRVRRAADDGFIAVGRTTTIDRPTGRDIWLAKYSLDGVIEWTRELDSGAWTNYPFAEARFGRGDFADDEGFDVWPNPDGTYIVAARSEATLVVGSPTGDGDFDRPTGATTQIFKDARSTVLMKITGDGALIWKRRITEGQFAPGLSGPVVSFDETSFWTRQSLVRPTFDGGALMFFRETDERGHVLRYDAGGVVLWRHETEEFDVLDMLQIHEPAVDDPAPGVRDDGFAIVATDGGVSRVTRLTANGGLRWRREVGEVPGRESVNSRILLAVEQHCAPHAGPFGLQCTIVAGGGATRSFDRPLHGYLLRLGETGDIEAEAEPDTRHVVDIRAIDAARLSVLARDRNASDEEPVRFGLLLTVDAQLREQARHEAGAQGGQDAMRGFFEPDGSLMLQDPGATRWWTYVLGSGTPVVAREVSTAALLPGEAVAVSEVAPGSYVIAGNRMHPGRSVDGWLVRLTDGEVAWQRQIPSQTNSRRAIATAMAPSADGGVVVAGHLYSQAETASRVIKFSGAGELQWESDILRRELHEMHVSGVVALPDGYAVLATTHEDFVRYGYGYGTDLYRLDGTGRLLWQRAYHGMIGNTIIAIDSDDDGAHDDGFLFASNSSDLSSPISRPFVRVSRIAPNGDVVWSRNYQVRGARSGTPPRLAQVAREFVIGLSETDAVAPNSIPLPEETGPDGEEESEHFPYGESNVMLLAVDFDGNPRWTRSFGALLDETLSDLRGLPDGGLLIAGSSRSFGDGAEAWILRLGAGGAPPAGCNAYLGGLGIAAVRVSETPSLAYLPNLDAPEALDPLVIRPANALAHAASTVEARQCLGSTAPPAPPVPQSILTVAQPGTQTGVVTSLPAGIVCGTLASAPPCEARFATGFDVVLAVDPGSVSRFVRWEGCDEILAADSGGATRCRVTMSRDREVRAIFGAPRDRFLLRVTVAGLGSVSTGDPEGISCGAFYGSNQDCSHLYDAFVAGTTLPTSITLSVFTHLPEFRGWSGDCAQFGAASSFNLIMDSDKHCTATFMDAGVHHLLDVQRSGTGVGIVLSDPDGIECPEDCSNLFSQGTTVRLLASAGLDSGFAGWTGCDRVVPASTPQSPICEVDMDAARSASAAFDRRVGFEYQLEFVVFGEDGIVESADHGIICTAAGPDCQEFYPAGISVPISYSLLRGGGTFLGWGGDCAHFNLFASGNLQMNGDKRCTATFSSPATPAIHTLSVQKRGPALVVSAPLGINCGTSCSAPFPRGSEIRLTVAPQLGFTLSGWSGCDRFAAGPGGHADCIVDMSSDRVVEVRIE
jgi:hypothetical protein